MNAAAGFDYERFVELSGSSLVDYMEPLVDDPGVPIPPGALDRLLSDLPSFNDEYHLVYALTLGAYRSPETFAQHLPPYLANEHQSVRLAASRMLIHLPDAFIGSDLVEAVRHFLLSCPEKEHMADMLDELEKRAEII